MKTNCNAIELRTIQKAVQTFFCCESNFQGYITNRGVWRGGGETLVTGSKVVDTNSFKMKLEQLAQ